MGAGEQGHLPNARCVAARPGRCSPGAHLLAGGEKTAQMQAPKSCGATLPCTGARHMPGCLSTKDALMCMQVDNILQSSRASKLDGSVQMAVTEGCSHLGVKHFR